MSPRKDPRWGLQCRVITTSYRCRAARLELHWEVQDDPMCGEYYLDEITAEERWELWIDK